MAAEATAISIARAAAAIVGNNEPSSLAAATEPASRQLLALLNRCGRELAEKRGPFGEPWPQLLREHSITAAGGTANYPLPADFAWPVGGTARDATEYRRLSGPAGPQYRAWLETGLANPEIEPRFWFEIDAGNRAMTFRLGEVPAEGQRFTFRYASRNWVRANAASPIALDEVTRDTEVPAFTAHLLQLDLEWRLRRVLGQEYRDLLAEFELERDRQFALAGGMPTLRMCETPAEMPINLGTEIPTG